MKVGFNHNGVFCFGYKEGSEHVWRQLDQVAAGGVGFCRQGDEKSVGECTCAELLSRGSQVTYQDERPLEAQQYRPGFADQGLQLTKYWTLS